MHRFQELSNAELITRARALSKRFESSGHKTNAATLSELCYRVEAGDRATVTALELKQKNIELQKQLDQYAGVRSGRSVKLDSGELIDLSFTQWLVAILFNVAPGGVVLRKSVGQ